MDGLVTNDNDHIIVIPQDGGYYNLNEHAEVRAWYRTKYAIYLRYSHGGDYTISNGNIQKQLLPNGSNNNVMSNMYIPIKRASGYSKVVVTMGVISAGNTGTHYVACVPCYIDANNMMQTIVDKTVYGVSGSLTTYELDISRAEYVDYIVLGAGDGVVEWSYIALE